MALRNEAGTLLGVLCILARQPFENIEFVHQLLQIFGTRATAELERQRTEHAFQNLIAGTAALTGPDFFTALVSHIAEALGASHAFVNEWFK